MKNSVDNLGTAPGADVGKPITGETFAFAPGDLVQLLHGDAMTSAAIGTSHTQASLVTLLREAHESLTDAWEMTQSSLVDEAREKLDQAIEALTKPNPDAQGFYWWLVAIGFAESRVVDGVQLDAGAAHNMVRNTYQFIRGRDIRTKIIAQPSSEAIEKARSKTDEGFVEMRTEEEAQAQIKQMAATVVQRAERNGIGVAEAVYESIRAANNFPVAEHAYLSAGDSPYASGDRAYTECVICGKSRQQHG